MKTSTKYSPEVPERAVWMVQEHQSERDSPWATIESVTGKLGGTTREEQARVLALRQANGGPSRDSAEEDAHRFRREEMQGRAEQEQRQRASDRHRQQSAHDDLQRQERGDQHVASTLS